MISKPFLPKNQAPPLSTKKSRFQSQVRHELLLTLEASNQQIIKNKKVFTWNYRSETADAPRDFPSQPLNRTMKSDRNVQRLHLFYKQDLQRLDLGLNRIVQVLKEFPYLKTLILSFKDVEGFYQLGKQLSRLVHLRKMKLSFRITDQELHCLTQGIRKLLLIEELDLGFTEDRITDKGLHDIRQCVKSLPYLKKVALSFDSSQITDAGLYEIHRGLKNLVCLESLRLNFVQASITDTGIQHIGRSFKGLTGIKSIQLHCSFCERITDKSLLTLGKDLKGLDTVQNIDITFFQCSLTDKGIDAFGKLLKRLKKRVKFQSDGMERIQQKQRKRNEYLAYIGALGLIGWSLVRIISSLLSLGNENFSWMLFLLSLFGFAIGLLLIWVLTVDAFISTRRK